MRISWSYPMLRLLTALACLLNVCDSFISPLSGKPVASLRRSGAVPNLASRRPQRGGFLTRQTRDSCKTVHNAGASLE
eukprot:168621-Rhodomonas_salina.2